MITIKEAEEILKKEYHLDNYSYLIGEILLNDFTKDEHDVIFNNQLFKSVKQLGYSNSCQLTVFEVYLNEGCQNKRVLITQEMFKILRGLRIDNAIVSFVNNDINNYRISLLTSKYEYDGDKIIKVISNPRRFSYSLGYGTKTKTAYKYLISKGKVKDLEELISRFSVEVVNKQFYSEIAEAFTKLIGGKFGSKKYDRTLVFNRTIDEKKYSEFGVRLIGRILFCWFLREKKSDNGIALIPNKFFDKETILNSELYYNEILEPLFFELLNTKINRRKNEFLEGEFRLIPYLNGGLFSPHPDDNYLYNPDKKTCADRVSIPNGWFLDLYQTLSEYNFTVDENTAYDIELSIDPEILGRIFENLLAEINPETGENAKKNTGSFYTPRDVVDYMVDTSLFQYLKKETNIDDVALKGLISYSKEDDLYVFNDFEKKSIIDALYKVTVYDPACGSGAFPIGMLQKIVYILQELDPTAKMWLNKSTDNIDPIFKREIENKFSVGSLNYIRKISVIQNSIFGSDIQPIAVEISRLRCFLSLIIEEKVKDDEENRGINPLPNLDFKFVIANSLVKLDNSAQMTLFENIDNIKALKNVREEYFIADTSRRNELKLEFANIQQNMLLESIQLFAKSPSKKYYQLSAWKPFANEPTDWFDKDWMFGVNEGFDIVIGNPPYIGTGSRDTSGRMSKEEKEYYRNNYPNSAEYKINMYALFMEFAINSCKNGGVSSFIVPDSFLLGMYFSKIRAYILKTCKIKHIAILGSDVFNACVGYSVIYLFQKQEHTDDDLMKFIDVVQKNGFVDDSHSFAYPQSYAKKTDRSRFRIFFDKETKNLIDKIENNSCKLGENYTGRTGVRSKIGQKNILALSQEKPTYKKGITSGSQVIDYKVIYEGDWINIDPPLLNAGGWDKDIIENPKLFVRQTADTIIAAYDEDGLYHLNNVHSFAPNNDKWNIKYILAILNSKVIRWYYEILANEKGRPMPQTDIETLETLPIKYNEDYVDDIVELVEKIISDYDNKEVYIKELDEKIFDIYGLDDNDKNVIKKYFGISYSKTKTEDILYEETEDENNYLMVAEDNETYNN